MGCCRLFTILTVMRTGAVIPAARGEIGLADRVWTIPAARMKGERAKEDTKDFRVPLSAAALTIAGEQGAKLWELRAAVSLARLRSNQGRLAEARDLLAPVYGWFTEGFDTADLKEAKALLELLNS